MKAHSIAFSKYSAILAVCSSLVLTSCGKEPSEKIIIQTKTAPSEASGQGKQRPERPPSVRPDPEFTKVTDTFGELVVWPDKKKHEFQVSVQPWPAYYYPFNKPLLFSGENSAFAKYDRYVTEVKKQPNPHAQAEEEKLYNNNYFAKQDWEGLCNAFSYASLSFPEPKHAVKVKGANGLDIVFEVGDLKGLLLKAFEATVPPIHFGQEFRSIEDGDDPTDIYPDQFHKFLQVVFFGRKHPFVIDWEPGPQIWNDPIYKASTLVTLDQEDQSIVHVETFLTGAELLLNEELRNQTRADLQGTGGAEHYFSYTYDLKGELQSNGSFKVYWGIWTGSSKRLHPDYVIAPFEAELVPKSNNKALKLEVLKELLSRAS